MPHPFAAERSLRHIQALIGGERFESIEEANARLAELTRQGRIAEMANAWNRDDPKWRAQELAYDAMETDDFVDALRLAHEAVKLDPNCADAQRLIVSAVPMTAENRVDLMRELLAKVERSMGNDFIGENTGRFWGNVATRPYMRTVHYLGELLAETGDFPGATSIFERMLKLNPTDNQGVRYSLVAFHLAANRPDAACLVMSRYPREETVLGSFAWARVLERWLAGELGEAEAELARARRVNPFVEGYITGVRSLPREGPEYYRPGHDSEAQVCAREFAVAWRKHPGFGEWLRTRR